MVGVSKGTSVIKVVKECIFLLLFGVAPVFLAPKTNG